MNSGMFVRACFHCTRFVVLVPSNLPSPSRPFAPGCTFSFLLLFPALQCRQTRDSTHRSVMRIRSFTHKVYLFQHFRCIKCISKYRSGNRRGRARLGYFKRNNFFFFFFNRFIESICIYILYKDCRFFFTLEL